MSLGYARDSYLNLAELAKEKEDEHSNSLGDTSENVDQEGKQHDECDAAPSPLTDGNKSAFCMKAVHMSLEFVEEEKKKEQPVAAVTFAYDYDFDYDYYPNYPNYGTYPYVGETQKKKSLWCCLFPMFSGVKNNADNELNVSPLDESDSESEVMEQSPAREVDSDKVKSTLKSSSREEDDRSVGSDALGEKLSQKDRKAVLARLRLAQPDSAARVFDQSKDPSICIIDGKSSEKGTSQKGLLDGIPCANEKSEVKLKKPTGILKRTSIVVKPPESASSSVQGNDAKPRRALFPTYDTSGTKPRRDLNVNFANLARVVSIKSSKHMDEDEKSGVWWQKDDYEGFRKTARLISKAMLEGGSEVWLASNQSWQKTPNSNRTQTLQNAYALSYKRMNSVDTVESIETTSDKWWHLFGHSRRGLEHIASMQEGKERQSNCQRAIRAVIDEQRRQRMYSKSKTVDPEKLRMVSINNTHWAKDLAMAAGASDADAVKQNFDDAGRKSREFYLLNMTRNQHSKAKGDNVPMFMKPAYNLQQSRPISSQTIKLDVRSSQRSNKRAQLINEEKPNALVKNAIIGESDTRTTEPLNDNSTNKSISRRAAGFSHAGAEKVNMSAILSGMGAATKEAQSVGA